MLRIAVAETPPCIEHSVYSVHLRLCEGAAEKSPYAVEVDGFRIKHVLHRVHETD